MVQGIGSDALQLVLYHFPAISSAGFSHAAIAELLELVRRNRKWNEDAARTQLLTIFEAMGPTDPRTIEARRKLSGLLFS